MKAFLKKVVKINIAIFLYIGTICCFISTISIILSKESIFAVLIMIFFTYTFWLFATSLTRNIKNSESNATINQQNIIKENTNGEHYINPPPEALGSAAKYFNTDRILNLLRILEDCKYLVMTSENIDTVIDRLNLGIQHAYTIKQLEQNGLYNGTPTSNDYLNIFLEQKESIINRCLNRAYKDMLNKSSELKTERGKYNRYKKFIEQLHKYDEEYAYTINEEYVKQIEEDLNNFIMGYALKYTTLDKPKT
ncbi:MAG: hypothetical protein PHD60_07240 [Clostridia bacterium]|nr:hypothetical protein [Clostridia bacterium]